MKGIVSHNKGGFINGLILVNDEDYEWLNEYKWHISNRYAMTHIKYNNNDKKISMHRLIMNEPIKMDVDHIDHNPLNNCKNNLRVITHSQNLMNSNVAKNTLSKYKGVTWNKQRNKWQAQIMYLYKNYNLGLFINEIDAAEVYNEAAKKYFGGYAYLNKIE